MSDVALRLKQWRKSRGLTLREVGEAVGKELGRTPLPANSVSNYERRNGPTLSFLAALSRAYKDVDLYWLMHGASNTIKAPISPEKASSKERDLIDSLMKAPFDNPKVFLTREEMTKAERTTYDMAALSALRTISRSLCTDARRFRER